MKFILYPKKITRLITVLYCFYLIAFIPSREFHESGAHVLLTAFSIAPANDQLRKRKESLLNE